MILTRLNLDFGLRQRDNPPENQAITATGGLAAGSFDSRRGRKFLMIQPSDSFVSTNVLAKELGDWFNIIRQ